MALGPPPSPMLAWSRTLFSPDFGLGNLLDPLFDFWVNILELSDLQWRRFAFKCEDTASAVTADDAFFTLDVVNYTANNVDPTWTTGDYDAVTNQMAAAFTALKPSMLPIRRWSEVKAYIMKFNDAWPGSAPGSNIPKFEESGPADYVATLNITGTGTGQQAAQVACSVTEIVPRRANWGRFFFPGLAGANLDPLTGRIAASAVDLICTSFHGAFQTLASSELYPVVPTTQVSKDRVASLQNVAALRVDDVPDVVRRRRLKYAIYRKELGV